MKISLVVDIETKTLNKDKINDIMRKISQSVSNRHAEVVDIRPAAIRPDEWEDPNILGTLLCALVNKNGGEMFIPINDILIGRVALDIDNKPDGSRLKLKKSPDMGGFYQTDS